MSPFEIFRRNLKPLMVFLTALALFAFVVLPAMQSYLQSGGANMADPQIAVFDGVPVTQSRVDYLTRNHRSTVNFLRELGTETIARGGTPRTPGFVYDTQSRQIRSVGIDEQPSPLSTVRTLQFASEATKAGFELDDPAIRRWLNDYTDGMVSDGEIISMLMNSTRNQMGQYHLYEQLRNQLLAELYQRGALAGVVQGQFPIMTPAEQWVNFLKVNQKATIDSYGVLVNDYIDQTNETPSQAEIEAVYKDGVARYPSEQSPEPGFRKRETATFEFLVADTKKFIDKEIEAIGEESLRAEYEKRLKGGDFQLPDLPDRSEDAKPEEKPAAEESEAEKPDDATGADEKADAGEKKEMKDAESKTEPAEEPAAEASDKGEQEADESEKFRERVESFKKEIDAVREEAKQNKPADDDQSLNRLPAAVRLVAFQQDEPETESTESGDEQTKQDSTDSKQEPDSEPDAGDQKDEAPAEDEKPEAKDDEKPSDDADSGKKDSGEPQDDKDKPADDTKKGDEEKPSGDTKTDADDKPAEDAKAGEKPKPAGDAAKQDEKAEPKVESFEDVRDQIAQSLATRPAVRKIELAIQEVMDVMRRYFNEKAIHDSNVLIGKAGDPPTKPDLSALAEKLGLEFQALAPHDVVSISNEPISRSNEAGQMGRPGPSFVQMMYGVQTSQQFMPKQQLYSPLRTTDTASGRVYISWKVAEQEGYVPELDEVRGEVIMAIRKSEARELAHATAEKIAERINAGEAFADVIPEAKKTNLKEGLGPFSWMMSFGFQGAFIGNVPELDSVGDEFMKTVFSTEVTKAGVAANDPERVIYVVRPIGFQPQIDDLKQIFKQPQERMMALPLGSNDVRTILQGFYKSVDERTGFNYVEDEQM